MITSSIIIFLLTFFLVCYSIKKIIYIAHKKHLFDEPVEVRKIHLTQIPNLGGVAIFASMMFIACIFFSNTKIQHFNYIIFAALSLFILGVFDDLVGVNPYKKMLAQIGVATAVGVMADCRFTSFYGIFGIDAIPYTVSILTTIIFVLFVVNAFNLIDGINCLAGSIGFLACCSFSIYFFLTGQPEWTYVSVAMCGCLLGFLVFNRTPAKIFMGDTGSMFLGLIVALLSINFLELNKSNTNALITPLFKAAPALLFALLIIPVFDTLRIFSIRILNGKSPFEADSNHIHHRLIDLNLSHMQATGILVLVNIISLLLVYFFYQLSTELLFFAIAIFILVLNSILSFLHTKKQSSLLLKTTHKNVPNKRPKNVFQLSEKNPALK